MKNVIKDFLKNGTILSKDRTRVLIGFGKRTWSSEIVNEDIPNFYFPDFFLKTLKPWFTHEHWMEISIDELLRSLLGQEPQKVKWDFFDVSFFESKFEEIKEKILKEELIKAVPYLFETTKDKMNEEQLRSSLFHALNYTKQYPAFIYGLFDDGTGFLGATPETLFTKENEQDPLKTMACAGTYSSEIKNVVIDNTLHLEHEVVVKGIVDALSPFGQLKIKPFQSLKFAKLTHLVTPIEINLAEPLRFTRLVHALHPTPALGAYPKDEGMFFLEQYQSKVSRGRFGAPAGFCHNFEAKCYVAIRNIQWDEKGMKMGAGCGIVKGSLLDKELLEIQLKLNAIKELLNI